MYPNTVYVVYFHDCDGCKSLGLSFLYFYFERDILDIIWFTLCVNYLIIDEGRLSHIWPNSHENYQTAIDTLFHILIVCRRHAKLIAGVHFRECFYRFFAGINFCKLGFTEDLAGINFRELSLTKDFAWTNFRECALYKDFVGENFAFSLKNIFRRH